MDYEEHYSRPAPAAAAARAFFDRSEPFRISGYPKFDAMCCKSPIRRENSFKSAATYNE